LETLNKHH
jgi:NADH:ubiquinone oxidoreductase subunit B-like Fe-S oxidoreductase